MAAARDCALACLLLALLIAQATQAADLSLGGAHGHHHHNAKAHGHHLRKAHGHHPLGAVKGKAKAKAAGDVDDPNTEVDEDEATAAKIREAKARAKAGNDDDAGDKWEDDDEKATGKVAKHKGREQDAAAVPHHKKPPALNDQEPPKESEKESQSDKDFMKQVTDNPDADPYELEAQREGVSLTQAPIIMVDPLSDEGNQGEPAAAAAQPADGDQAAQADMRASAEAKDADQDAPPAASTVVVAGASQAQEQAAAADQAAQADMKDTAEAKPSADGDTEATDDDGQAKLDADGNTQDGSGDAPPSSDPVPGEAPVAFAQRLAAARNRKSQWNLADPYHRNDLPREDDDDADSKEDAAEAHKLGAHGSMSKEDIQSMEELSEDSDR